MNKNTLKIFEVGECYWVLTETEEKAIDICIDNGVIDEDWIDDYSIEECNYKNYTWQPVQCMKNILNDNEIDTIINTIEQEKDTFELEKDGIKYFFQDMRIDLGYIAVHLTFSQILNDARILSEFDVDSIISTTEY